VTVRRVKLVKAPAGVKRFHSESAAGDPSFQRTLTRPGRYRFVCAFHADMAMTAQVR
jgi:plastocyanin